MIGSDCPITCLAAITFSDETNDSNTANALGSKDVKRPGFSRAVEFKEFFTGKGVDDKFLHILGEVKCIACGGENVLHGISGMV